MVAPWETDPKWALSDRHLRVLDCSPFQRTGLAFDGTPGIHTLLGPRRIGKSTQFKIWIRKLCSNPKTRIVYLDVERFPTWQDLLHTLEGISCDFLFLDEITAIENWTRALKVQVDAGSWDSTCVWLTGSNAFDLKSAGERLPGRRGKNLIYRDIELLPLTFHEFYDATKKLWSEISIALEGFCQWGGYPMAISECLSGRSNPSEDCLQELLDVSLGETSRKHRSPRLTAALAERIWLNLGSRTSYHGLAKAIGQASHPIMRQYIEILEGCYALLQVERFNAKTKTGVLRKEKKIYFQDPLILSALVSWAETGSVSSDWLSKKWEDPVHQGKILENIVATEFSKRKIPIFYDESHGVEVDFVYWDREQKHWSAIEVKRSPPSSAEFIPLKNYKAPKVLVHLSAEARHPLVTNLGDFLIHWKE